MRKLTLSAEFFIFAAIVGAFALLFAVNAFLLESDRDIAQAATVTSVASGAWSNPATWNTGAVPAAGDTVTIAAGHAVTYDVLSDAQLGSVNIDGTLKFSRTGNTRLKSTGNIMVRSGGTLDMGTAAEPIPASVRAEVIFVLPQGYVFTGGSRFQAADVGLWAMPGSSWHSHGAPLLHAWVKLAADASAGATTLMVESDVTDWRAGETIVVTQTSNPFRPSGSCNKEATCAYFWENETVTIAGTAAVAGGETRITLTAPLQFAHAGTGRTRGEVGLLTRNVLVRTEVTGVPDATLDSNVAERRFAHTILQHGVAASTLQYTEFKYMGHLSTLARYPLHIHMAGTAGNGVIFRGNSVWRSGNRGYQVHNSQGVLVEDNVTFDTVMSPYYVERSPHGGDPPTDRTNPLEAPNDNWFVHNLGVLASRAPSVGQAQQNDAAIFWFDQLDQVVLGNVGVGARSFGGNGPVPSGSAVGEAEENGHGGVYIDERNDNTGVIKAPVFRKNEIHGSGAHGWQFWQVAGAPFDMADITLWRNGTNGLNWGYYRSPYRLYQLTTVENGFAGVSSTWSSGSGSRYIQDAEIIGEQTGISNGVNNARPVYPDYPYTYVRVRFQDTVSAMTRKAKSETETCSGAESEWPVARRVCDAAYAFLLEPTFTNVTTPLFFGTEIDGVTTLNDGNKNAFWRVKDAQGLAGVPSDFLLFREDQQDSANQTSFNSSLLGATKTFDATLGGVRVPVSELPGAITIPIAAGHDGSTGSLEPSGTLPQTPYTEYTFEKAVDYPPEVTLAVTTVGKATTLTATATDDKSVAKVEFWLDDTIIATDTAPPYTATVDLAAHPRKYAYLYAVAYDAKVHTFRWADTPSAPPDEDYDQRAYSRVVEIGPEVILAGAPAPSPTPPAPSFNIADFNKDGKVNIFDVSILLSQWGGTDLSVDINGPAKTSDGTVNIFDANRLMANWTG